MKRFLLPLLTLLTLTLTLGLGCSSGNDAAEPLPTKPAPAAGTQPVPGPDGVPQDCNILFDGLCYKTMRDAAHAAGKDPKDCVVLETYPGQLSCEK